LRSQDSVIGVLTLYSLRQDAFDADDLRLLLAVAPKAGLAIQNAALFESASNAAETDELTGLPNARFLFSHLEKEVARAVECQGTLGIAVLDLDGFKAANDRYGHLTGNRILQAVALGLRRNCRPADVVARLGGDEFVLISRNSGPAFQDVVDRFKDFVGNLSVDGAPALSISISVGAASYPDDSADAEALLQVADERMYLAKHIRVIRAA
jgi:diguanylate cyclase (GGDEF)-like protein